MTGWAGSLVVKTGQPQVTSARATGWTTRQLTTSARATSWAGEATAEVVQVTETQDTSWDIIGRTVSTRAARWPTLTRVSTTRATRWANLVPVGQSRTTRWGIFAQATGATTVPMMRMRVYAPNGADLGPLPVPQGVSASYVMSDIGGLSFSYSPNAPKAELLGQPCELAVEVSPDSGKNWAEPANSRFCYISDGRDPLSRTDAYSVDAKSYVWRFSKARVLPNGLLNADGKRAFNSVTPGTLLKTLLQEAQTRGALAGISHATFSTTTDSSGTGWAKQLTIAYEPGLDYLAILQNLADQGFVDFRMIGRSLQVFNADAAMAVDRTVGAAQVIFRAGRDLTEAPFRRTWEGLANYAYFAGDGTSYEFTDTTAVTPWGRMETFISNGSVSDAGTMAALTQSELAQSNAERTEYTRGLDFSRAVSKPHWDYSVGDYVWSAVDGQAPERLRVRQLTLTNSDKNILGGSVVLNDRFLEADIRAKRRVEGITNGASSGTGTGGPEPEAAGPDSSVPNMPTGLTGSSAAYLGPGGFAQAQVSLSWSPPTTNTDGTIIDDLDSFELFERVSTSPPGTQKHVATTTDNGIDRSPYLPGTTYFFSVRAVDRSGNRSATTAEFQITMAQDITPPVAPSTPIVLARLGTVSVFWDGMPSTGTKWLPDFDHIQVHVSTINDFAPITTSIVDNLFAEGYSVLTGYPYGVPLYVKLVAVDKAGLLSTPSAQRSATPTRLVGSDIDANAIGYEQIAFRDPGNIVPDGSFETTFSRFTVAGRSSASWTFTTADRFHGDYSATADAAAAPSTYRDLFLMGTTEKQDIGAGDVLFARMAYRATTGASGNVLLMVEWTLTNGTLSWSNIPAGAHDNTWRTAAGKVTAPADVRSFRVYVELNNAATIGSYWVDAVEVRRVVGTEIIEDAAIGNAQIANLAVNDAKIADLTVGKLTAGTLTADVLMAGRFRTSTTGSRIEFDSTGIRMFNAATLTGYWMTSAGQLRIYNSTDASHTSTGHGLQFGDSTGQNLIIDNNELLSRFNGTYGGLLLNREGGRVTIGGRIGGFPLDSDIGVMPADEDHVISIRGAVQIQNVSDGEYADEYPPLMIGRPGGSHVWIDNNEIGATASTGDAVGRLYLQPPRNTGTMWHSEYVVLAANSLGVRRWGVYDNGTRATLLAGYGDGMDIGIKISGDNDKVYIVDGSGGPTKSITASAFNVSSERRVKHHVAPVADPLAAVRSAPSRRWKYNDEVETADRWHIGPMHEDLPDEVTYPGNPNGEVEAERSGSVDLASMLGLLWAAVAELADKVDAALDPKEEKR